MSDVDAFTQRMLDRARQRRENLDKKMAETTPRKRAGIPLGENQESNLLPMKSYKDEETATRKISGLGQLTVHLSSPNNERIAEEQINFHDSPNKKQCLRTEEISIKADTPAIPSVRSRLHGLAALRNTEGDDRMEVDPPQKPARAPEPQLDDNDYHPKPASRRNRLAALAQTINTWEDDLSRPVIKNEQKPKKVWQPPKPPAEEPSQPTKPPRTFEYTKIKSPQKPVGKDENTSDFLKRIAPSDFTTTKQVSPVKFSPTKNVSEQLSPIKMTKPTRFFPSPKPVVSTMTVQLGSNSPQKTTQPKEPETDTEEPTKKPISTRFASWQKKTGSVGQEKEPTKQSVSNRMATWESKGKSSISSPTSGHFKTPNTKREQSPVKEPRRDLFDVSMHDPLNMSVHSRMGVWEKKVDQSAKEKEEHIKSQQQLRARSPLKTGGIRSTSDFKNAISKKASEVQSRQHENSSVSPMKSPSKIFALTRPTVGKATKELHSKLTQLDKNWQNNEIAERIKRQKEADMALLQNRWKNGIPEDSMPTVDHCTNNSVEAVPAPPPPPPNAEIRTNTTKTPTKPISGKREEARDKIRAASGAPQSLGSLISSETKNFEQKLCAMGFEVTPSKTATLDLTPLKEKEKQKRTVVRSSPKKTVHIEETKITSTKFNGEEKVHVSTKTFPVSNHTSTYSTTLQTEKNLNAPSTPSIYNLIKKTPASGTPRPVMGKLHDSFDSDDSFESSDNAKMPPPSNFNHQNTRVSVTTTIKRQDSLSSTQSETQSDYSEVTDTHTEDYTEDYTEEEESQYTEEDEYSSEEESADNSQLDDLLDEAMDDTEVTETESETIVPVAPPRRNMTRQNSRNNRPVSYHGSTSSKDSRSGSDSSNGKYDHILRRPGETPAERDMRRNRRGVTFAEGTSTSEVSSAESEEEKPQVYSIDLYRASWNSIKSQNKVTPKMTIVRHTERSRRFEEEDEPLPYVPEKSVRQKLQELQELVTQEQTVIQQTSNALNQCCGSNSMFAGSAEAVECHRLLLIACKKREAYITEMQRLRDGGDSMLGRQPQGSLTLSDIRLPLKREFMSRIGGPNDNTVHYFICMIRNGAHVVLTQMMSTHDAMVRDSLDFPNLIQLKDIKQNFRFDLEIYGMSVTREVELSKTPKKQKKGLTPKKWLKGSTPSRNFQSPAGPTAVRSTNFVLVACLPITIKSVTKTHFSLDKVPYSAPLQGTIHLKLRCLMESSVIEKGFLTIFEDVSGFGAWHRRWFVLKNHSLSYWKYPDDEKFKEPIGYIDLKYCISEKIGLIPRDICARPNTFEILTVRRQQRGEKDTLTSWVSNTVSTTRHMLSADTKEDRLIWSERLNEALANVRSWSPEALRPIKVQAVEDPSKPMGGNKYQQMTNI